MYKIKFVKKKDLKKLSIFFNNHWKKKHIFTTNKKLFNWQHLNKQKSRFNFIVAHHNKSDKPIAILGFIPTSQFDNKIEINNFVWLAIWKVIDRYKGKKIGTELLNFLIKNLKPKVLCTVGASEMTLAIYKSKGFIVGQLQHYYILNPGLRKFKLVAIKRNKIPFKNKSSSILEILDLKKFNTINKKFFTKKSNFPLKTKSYFINRYFKHPSYTYQVHGIFNKSKLLGVIFLRISRYKNSSAIKVIDFFGHSKNLKGLYYSWVNLLNINNAEYIDFYCAGINHNHLIRSGFVVKDVKKSLNIIPNYFEPFVKKNITINYMINLKRYKNFRIVRGDSDQDRPNI